MDEIYDVEFLGAGLIALDKLGDMVKLGEFNFYGIFLFLCFDEGTLLSLCLWTQLIEISH
jgi:hypothetical protein